MFRTIGIVAFVTVHAFTTAFLQAQDWGKVPDDQLRITAYPKDSTADAVVLFDNTQMVITDDFNLELERHCRIKILTEAGKDRGSIGINYYHEDRLSGLKAQSISPGGEKTKLEDKNIHDKKGFRWNEKVFSIPGIEVGSVIEFKYRLESDYIHYLEPWFFQHKDWTESAKLSVDLPLGFDYQSFVQNPQGYELLTDRQQVINPFGDRKPIIRFAWSAGDVPGLKEEPYTINMKDNLGSVQFQISSYHNNDYSYTFVKTWKDIAKRISETYREHLSLSSDLETLSRSLTESLADTMDKAKAIYEYVRKSIATGEFNGLLNQDLKKPNDVLKSRQGSAVEKNLLLINLLRSAGMDCQLVLISTRNHGKVEQYIVDVNAFNHIIARVKSGGRIQYLDAKNRYCPFGELPSMDYADYGFLILDEDGEFVNLPKPPDDSVDETFTKAELNETGDLSALTKIQFKGMCAQQERETIAEMENQTKYVKSLLQDRFADVEVDTFQIAGLDSLSEPLTLDLGYRVRQAAQVSGDFLYVNPVFLHRIPSNPLNAEKRTYPVEFQYPCRYHETVDITVPEKYRISETTPPQRMAVWGVNYQAGIEMTGRRMLYTRNFQRTQAAFPAREYINLRRIFEYAVNADAVNVVLQRGEL